VTCGLKLHILSFCDILNYQVRLKPDRVFSAAAGGSKLQLGFTGFSFEAQSASVGDLEFDRIFYDGQFRIGDSPLFYGRRPLALIHPADFKTSQTEKAGFSIPDLKALNSIEAWRPVLTFLLLVQKPNIAVSASFSNAHRQNSDSPHFARAAEISLGFSENRVFFVENSRRYYLSCALLYQMTDSGLTGFCEGLYLE
jgi:hypothetical protein